MLIISWWVFLILVIVGVFILVLKGIIDLTIILVAGEKWERIIFAVLILLFVLFIWWTK